MFLNGEDIDYFEVEKARVEPRKIEYVKDIKGTLK